MKVFQSYYLIDGKLFYDHGQIKGSPTPPPVFVSHSEGQARKPLALSDLKVGKKFRYGAVAKGCWDLYGYPTKFGYQPRHVDRFEGQPAEIGQYFYVDQDEPQNCDCYVAVSEVLNIETEEVYVPSDFIWGENGYLFVPSHIERPADGNPAKYEKIFTKITVELMLHGRAKFEVVTEVNESSIRVYRVYEPL